ncbi:hypothetical protein CDAR_199261 [Caerostris darwini]|uniref:Ribosomal protein S15 n=1 Tax=Caerostris darwini TaxID=1538125 RepID=A0AAV4QKD3_9ARAC|nr:hypothetical protein CDAR_199261 [Caerostris darwini]
MYKPQKLLNKSNSEIDASSKINGEQDIANTNNLLWINVFSKWQESKNLITSFTFSLCFIQKRKTGSSKQKVSFNEERRPRALHLNKLPNIRKISLHVLFSKHLTVIFFSLNRATRETDTHKKRKIFLKHLMGFQRRMKLLKSLDPCQRADHIHGYPSYPI